MNVSAMSKPSPRIEILIDANMIGPPATPRTLIALRPSRTTHVSHNRCRKASKRTQGHDGARQVKPAPTDPYPFDAVGRLALRQPSKLRIHRLGNGYRRDDDRHDHGGADPGEHRRAFVTVQREHHRCQRGE